MDNPRYAALAHKLNLSPPDQYDQDWEFTVAEPQRIFEWVELLKTGNLSTDEQHALMNIILSSYNESLALGGEQPGVWEAIRTLLNSTHDKFLSEIRYWALSDETDFEGGFLVTPILKKYIADRNDS